MGCGVGKRMLRSSMRTFSTVPSTSDEMVRLTDGTLGKVLTRKGGWVSVQLTTSNEVSYLIAWDHSIQSISLILHSYS